MVICARVACQRPRVATDGARYEFHELTMANDACEDQAIPGEPMSKFVIAPHMRLQEWVAEERGYFA
jgi:hypothetical protein